MIPRKLAQKLLAELREKLAEKLPLEPELLAGVAAVSDLVIEESVWVLRGAENVEQKARRYLAEGRLTVTRSLQNGLVVAECRGSAGAVYALGYDPARKEWRCTCPKVGKRTTCSHLAALQLVTAARA